MNKVKRLIPLLILGLSIQVMPDDGGIIQYDKDKLNRAEKILSGSYEGTITRKDFVAAVLGLLDAAAESAPDNQYRNDILHRIRVAGELIGKESLFNAKARQYLSFAYRQLTAGEKFTLPEELDTFITPAEQHEKAVRYVKGLFADLHASLNEKDRATSCRLLVEIVLITITPVSG